MAAAQPLAGSCEACLTANKVSSTPTGSLTTLGALPAYVARAGAAQSRSCVVIVTDIFGHSFANTQCVADVIASASGLDVFVPDVLAGDAVSPQGFDAATFPAWRAKHGDEVAEPALAAAVAALRAAGYAKIGAIGYCYGGRYSTRAAISGLVDASAVAHPSFISPGEFNALRTPSLFLCAETDGQFPAAAADEVEAALKAAGAPAEFRRYAGTSHGFAVRPPPGDAAAEAARDDAAAATAAHFRRHLA
jgi:dienelactone hydrolase